MIGSHDAEFLRIDNDLVHIWNIKIQIAGWFEGEVKKKRRNINECVRVMTSSGYFFPFSCSPFASSSSSSCCLGLFVWLGIFAAPFLAMHKHTDLHTHTRLLSLKYDFWYHQISPGPPPPPPHILWAVCVCARTLNEEIVLIVRREHNFFLVSDAAAFLLLLLFPSPKVL